MTALWTVLGKPQVVDLSHNNPDPIDFAALKADGVELVIHKATQGKSFVDPCYAPRRRLALDAGLKWDAYHFCTSSIVEKQVDHFLAVAERDDTMRLAIDVEQDGGSTISFSEADAMAAMLDDKLRLKCLRYTGGGYMTPAAVAATPHLRGGPIWWAKYGPVPRYDQLQPLGIDPASVVLWQETGSGERAGVWGTVDESYWIGPAGSLALYPKLSAASPAPPPPEFIRILRFGMKGDDVAMLQTRLSAAGYTVGLIDGDFGPATRSAVVRFQARNHLRSIDGIAGPETLRLLVPIV